MQSGVPQALLLNGVPCCSGTLAKVKMIKTRIFNYFQIRRGDYGVWLRCLSEKICRGRQEKGCEKMHGISGEVEVTGFLNLEENEERRLIRSAFLRSSPSDELFKEREWDQGRLEQVIVLCRHGVRLPEQSFPNFTFFPVNNSWWGKFGGQLTPMGVEQMRRIGERLGWFYGLRLRPSLGESVFGAAQHFQEQWEHLTGPHYPRGPPGSIPLTTLHRPSSPAAAMAPAHPHRADHHLHHHRYSPGHTPPSTCQATSTAPPTNTKSPPKLALRDHFISLIRPVQEKVQVMSSGYTRAVFSAQAMLLGLLPGLPVGFCDEADPQEKVFQAVRHTASAPALALVHQLGMDQAFAMGRHQAQRYKALKTRFFQDCKLREWGRSQAGAALLDKAHLMTGHRLFHPNQAVEVRMEALGLLQQQMEIEHALHMPLCANHHNIHLTPQEEDMLREVVDYMHHLKFEGGSAEDQMEMGAVSGGGTLHMVSNLLSHRMQALQRGALRPHAQDPLEHKQLVILSAHDQTIMAALAYLRMKQWPYPQLGACLIFELREVKGEYFVGIKYNWDPETVLFSSCPPLRAPLSLHPPHNIMDFSDLPATYVPLQLFNQCFNVVEKWRLAAEELYEWEKGTQHAPPTRLRPRQALLHDMQEVFNFCDKDGNGSINPAELGALVRMLGKNKSDVDLQKIFAMNDLDGKGMMDFEEFVNRSTNSLCLHKMFHLHSDDNVTESTETKQS